MSISLLVTVGAADDLIEQVTAAPRLGLDDVEIREIVTHLGLYVGLPTATAAMRVVNRVFGPPAGTP